MGWGGSTSTDRRQSIRGKKKEFHRRLSDGVWGVKDATGRFWPVDQTGERFYARNADAETRSTRPPNYSSHVWWTVFNQHQRDNAMRIWEAEKKLLAEAAAKDAAKPGGTATAPDAPSTTAAPPQPEPPAPTPAPAPTPPPPAPPPAAPPTTTTTADKPKTGWETWPKEEVVKKVHYAPRKALFTPKGCKDLVQDPSAYTGERHTI